jgi:hypothetical protein
MPMTYSEIEIEQMILINHFYFWFASNLNSLFSRFGFNNVSPDEGDRYWLVILDLYKGHHLNYDWR